VPTVDSRKAKLRISKFVPLPPDPSLPEILTKSEYPLPSAVAELVDNSIDSGAEQIVVRLEIPLDDPFAAETVVVLPVGSPLLRRELLYTAITRARKHLVLIASDYSITNAVINTINRASGLAARIRGN
jgi:hypothetical protein